MTRRLKAGMKIEALRSFSNQLTSDFMDDEKTIDFGNVGLYLAGFQVCFAVVCCGCVSVLCCWLLSPDSISAVRTLAITAMTGMILVRSPLRVGRVKGVATIFNALRPSVAVYVLALIVEQLVHTCVFSENDSAHKSTIRRAMYHIVSVFLVISGLIRAKNPRSESDLPFLVAFVCLLATALLPPPAISQRGPLCEPTDLLGAGERVLRALLFSAVYVVLVYAAAPSQNVTNELFICVARATAASVWVLTATSWALPIAPLQAAIALFSRLNERTDDTSPEHTHTAYGEHVPLNGAHSDVESEVDRLEAGIDICDQDSLKLALEQARVYNASNGTNGFHSVGNGLSFNFGSGRNAVQNSSGMMAAVAAREINGEF
jgi:hypothetical protein